VECTGWIHFLSLQWLRVDKSSGPKEMPARLLMEVAEKIVDTLVEYFHNSLNSGRVSEDWKTAKGRRQGAIGQLV